MRMYTHAFNLWRDPILSILLYRHSVPILPVLFLQSRPHMKVLVPANNSQGKERSEYFVLARLTNTEKEFMDLNRLIAIS